MIFTKYKSPEAFGHDVLDILLENEVQNNLPISFIKNEQGYDTSAWLMSSVKDTDGHVRLVSACTPPFNLVLYEPRNQPDAEAVHFLVNKLRELKFKLPGVLAEQNLAHRFASLYADEGNYHVHISMKVMRLDKVETLTRAPGRSRPLQENDLFFTPYWERAFGEECNVEFYSIPEHAEKIKKRLGRNTHFIWEDGIPVSQAVHGRSTENGAVVNGVYTPPYYRGKGYASSVVADLSQHLLDKGYSFCCLFADALNPISCGIYRKIGYIDQCVVDDVKFTGKTG